MSLLVRIILFIIVGVLTACAKPTFTPQEIASCSLICTQHLHSCQDNCTNNCPACSQDSSYTSLTQYLKYVQEKQIQGGFITRGLNSYRDPLQCRKVSCNCAADYITCKQGCTGVIHKKLRAVPYCT